MVVSRVARLLLAPSCALALALAPPATAAEEDEATSIIVATPWEVRRAASELLSDLEHRSSEIPRLLDRVQAMLAEHGDAPVPYGSNWTPLTQAMASHLEDIGLAETFRTFYGPAAARRLEELLAAPDLDEEAVAALARRYPGTEAAEAAWRTLANRAWDRGHLGSYLHRARRGGEPEHEHLAKRMRAARELLRPDAELDLPVTLDGLVEMWSIADLPLVRHRPAVRHNNNEEPPPATFAFSATDRDMVAASDGRLMFVLDPLFGERVGETHDLVGNPIGGPHLVPVVDGFGFVAVAMEPGSRPVIQALDHGGGLRWRSTIEVDNVSGMSPPVVLDALVAVAVSVPTGSGTELRVVAFDQRSGGQAWNVLVAKDPRGIRHRFRHFGGNSVAPSCTIHAGALVVCSNSGLIAEIGADGRLRRVWQYASSATRSQHLLDYRNERQGTIRSDGRHLVATPSDTNSVLVIGPEAEEPAAYNGLGAGDELLDLVDGRALLAGARISLLDVADGEPAWSDPVGSVAAARWGRIGRERVMVLLDSPEVVGQQIQLHARSDGKRIGERPVGSHDSVTIAGDLLLTAGPDRKTRNDTRIIIGYGDERGFQRLQARAEAEPDNPRPLIGLASLHRARGDLRKAYDHLVKALDLGAPEAMAHAAAKLARRLVDLSLGGEEFASTVVMLERLEPHLPGITSEATWWRGRHAELAGDTEAAAAAFRKVAASEPGMIEFVEGLAVDRHTLAEFGLARVGRGTLPVWATERPPDPLPLEAGQDWQWDRTFLSEPLIASGEIIGYTEGRLQGFSLMDGSVTWQRRTPEDEAPFLGVRMVGTDSEGSVSIEVIPGSAADHAGFKDGDVVTHFNGESLSGTDSLAAFIVQSIDSGDFTARIERPGEDGTTTVRELDGTLGTQLLQPVSESGDLVLARRMTLDNGQAGFRVVPDRIRNPTVEVVSRTTGAVLWSARLTTGGTEQNLPEPVLLDNGILLSFDQERTLTAVDLTGPEPTTAWTREDLGAGLQEMRILEGGLVLLTAEGQSQGRIIDSSDGTLVLALPMRSDSSLLLSDGDIFVHAPDGRLVAWNIGVGRQRWALERGGTTPLAAANDAVYVLDDERRLAILDRPSKETRMTFGAWPTIHESLVTPNQIFVHARKADGVDVVAAVDRATASVRWEYGLPERLELSGELMPIGQGVGMVLDTIDQPPGLLVVDGDGHTAMAHLLDEAETVIPTDNGVVASGPDGLRRLPLAIPPAGPLLACPEVATGRDLAASAAAAQETAEWREVGRSAYLVARSGKNLLILTRVEQDSDGITIHLADDGELSEAPTQTLVVRPGHSPVFDRRDGGWHLSGVRRVNPAEPAWSVAIRLTPPPVRRPGMGVRVRAAADGEVDGPAAPWWLRQSWRRLEWGKPPSDGAASPETAPESPETAPDDTP